MAIDWMNSCFFESISYYFWSSVFPSFLDKFKEYILIYFSFAKPQVLNPSCSYYRLKTLTNLRNSCAGAALIWWDHWRVVTLWVKYLHGYYAYRRLQEPVSSVPVLVVKCFQIIKKYIGFHPTIGAGNIGSSRKTNWYLYYEYAFLCVYFGNMMSNISQC